MEQMGLYVLLGAILVVLLVLIAQVRKLSEKPTSSQPKMIAPQPTAAPAVAPGVPAEVVAAIAGAVAAMSGGTARVRSVSRATASAIRGRGNWGVTGVQELTESFM